MEKTTSEVSSIVNSNPALEGHERVYFKQSAIHRVGAFARKSIRSGTRVIEYVGEKISKEVSEERLLESNPYIFVLDDTFDLDGDVDWNPAKYLNHSCSPNCESDVVDGRVWILALRPIKPHEELTYNYGFDLSEFGEYPCECGSPDCLGFIVAAEHFDEVRKRAGKAKASRKKTGG